MRNYDLESAFAIRRASVTESSTISFECPHLNPDWLASSSLCFDRGSLTYAINLIQFGTSERRVRFICFSSGLQSAEREDNWLKQLVQAFSKEWKERDRSVAICKLSI